MNIKADLNVDARVCESREAYTYLDFLILQLPKEMPILLEFLALMRYGGKPLACIDKVMNSITSLVMTLASRSTGFRSQGMLRPSQ